MRVLASLFAIVIASASFMACSSSPSPEGSTVVVGENGGTVTVTAADLAALPSGAKMTLDRTVKGRAYLLDTSEGDIDYTRVLLKNGGGDRPSVAEYFAAKGHVLSPGESLWIQADQEEETKADLTIEAPGADPAATTCCHVGECRFDEYGYVCDLVCGPCITCRICDISYCEEDQYGVICYTKCRPCP